MRKTILHITDLSCYYNIEQQFLVNCVAYAVSGRDVFAGVFMHTPLRWDVVKNLSLYHRIVPLVHDFLERHPNPNIPDKVSAYFRNASQVISFTNYSLTEDLLAISSILEKHKIIAAPLKGPVLAAMGYRHIGLRQFTDIDILIRKSDLIRIKTLLAGHGYDSENGVVEFENECELYLQKNNRNLKLDIHWSLVESHYGYEYTVDSLFSRARNIALAGTKILSLCQEDVLLATVFHHGKEGWKELRYIADLGGLINRQKDLDWNFLIEKSKQLGTERNLFLGLYLTNKLIPGHFSDVVSPILKNDSFCKKIGDPILKNYFIDPKGYTPGDFKYDLGLQQNLNPRMRSFPFVIGSLQELIRPNHLDKSAINLPARLHFLYYFIRLGRLLRAYGLSKVFKSLFRWLNEFLFTSQRGDLRLYFLTKKNKK